MTKKVDNSGKGNCMYYAYGISLMYFLLKKRDKVTAEQVFDKLELSPLDKRRLHSLLDYQQLREFTPSQLTKIIENIIGPAARKIAAKQTTAEFLAAPSASSLSTATNYGMMYVFRKELEKQKSELGTLLKNNKFNDPSYTNAEIYLLFKAKPNSELGRFAAAHYEDVIEKFKLGWPDYKDKIQKQKKVTEIDEPFHKKQFLETLIANKTIEFFQENSNQHLKEYEAHLNTNYRQATEETMMVLHRYVTGEHAVGPNGNVHFEYETEINLAIYKNGRGQEDHRPGVPNKPDMILNNIGDFHWMSFVEPADAPLIVKKDLRNDCLDVCGFNTYLAKLQIKAAELASTDPQASEEAFDIFDQLNAVRKDFVKEQSNMDPEKFSKACEEIITDAPRDNLKQHRGIGKILNGLVNIAVSFANAFLTIANTIGTFKYIDYDRIDTKSIQQVNSLVNASKNALIVMKEQMIALRPTEQPSPDSPPPLIP